MKEKDSESQNHLQILKTHAGVVSNQSRTPYLSRKNSKNDADMTGHT